MERFLKVLYCATLVLPVIRNAVVHLYGFCKDTVIEIRDTWQEAWRK